MAKVINSLVCILAITILGASLLGACMASKEEKALTTQRWRSNWGWGQGWGGGRGYDTPSPPPQRRGWGWDWGRSWGRGRSHQETPPAPPQGQGRGWGWGRGHQEAPPAPPQGRGWGWGQEAPPTPPQGEWGGWGWYRGRGRGHKGQDAPPVGTPRGQGESPAPASTPRGQAPPPTGTPQGDSPPAGTPQGESPPAAGTPHGGSDCPLSQQNRTRGSRGLNKIVIGGSKNWNFGFNYSDWALKNGPFYINDVLVFKYNAPVNGSSGHSVYLLPDFQSYLKCDLSRATQLATTTQGGGNGFEFKLTKWQPHYFACGEHNGIHCNLGMMKFMVMPIFRYWN